MGAQAPDRYRRYELPAMAVACLFAAIAQTAVLYTAPDEAVRAPFVAGCILVFIAASIHTLYYPGFTAKLIVIAVFLYEVSLCVLQYRLDDAWALSFVHTGVAVAFFGAETASEAVPWWVGVVMVAALTGLRTALLVVDYNSYDVVVAVVTWLAFFVHVGPVSMQWCRVYFAAQ
tara:strand:+ start:144 stop:665 length:522 start_codon:yes stop_codon:yes gene_type:complete